MDNNQTFESDDFSELQNHGLATPLPDDHGSVRVHKRRLNRSSDEEHHNLQLPSPLSPAPDDAFAKIPKDIISHATLQYLGFSAMKASDLWQQWTNWDAGEPPVPREVDVGSDFGGLTMTFYDFLTGSLFNDHADSTSEERDDWVRCLNAYGISEELQEALLDPRFEKARFSETCLYWIRDTVDLRYNGLLSIQAASVERSKSQRRQTLRETQNQSGGSSAIPGSHRLVSNELQQAVTGLRVFPDLLHMRQWAARHAPGRTVLWKGIGSRRIDGLFDMDGNLADIGKLISHAPGDFNGRSAAYYFSANYKVAEYYASWAKRRAENNQAFIIRIELENRDIESLEEPEIFRLLWPRDDWKELVWFSRRGKRLPNHLCKYANATLMIGTIAKGPNLAFHRLDTPDIGIQYILRLSSDEAAGGETQFVFHGEKGEDFLLEHIASIETTVFTRGHLLEENVSEE